MALGVVLGGGGGQGGGGDHHGRQGDRPGLRKKAATGLTGWGRSSGGVHADPPVGAPGVAGQVVEALFLSESGRQGDQVLSSLN